MIPAVIALVMSVSIAMNIMYLTGIWGNKED